MLQAQIALAQARKALRETTLRAPSRASSRPSTARSATRSRAAVATSRPRARAEARRPATSSGFQFGLVELELVTITGQDKLQVVAGFSEGDAASIKVGEPATATISALPGVPSWAPR